MIQERMATGILPSAERPKVMQETVQSDKNLLRATVRPKVMQETVQSNKKQIRAAVRPRVMRETVQSDKNQLRAAARPRVMRETAKAKAERKREAGLEAAPGLPGTEKNRAINRDMGIPQRQQKRSEALMRKRLLSRLRR